MGDGPLALEQGQQSGDATSSRLLQKVKRPRAGPPLPSGSVVILQQEGPVDTSSLWRQIWVGQLSPSSRAASPLVCVSQHWWGGRAGAAALQTPGPSGPRGDGLTRQLLVPGGEGPMDTRLCALGCVVGPPTGTPLPLLLMTGSENGLGLGTGQARPGEGWPPPGSPALLSRLPTPSPPRRPRRAGPWCLFSFAACASQLRPPPQRPTAGQLRQPIHCLRPGGWNPRPGCGQGWPS